MKLYEDRPRVGNSGGAGRGGAEDGRKFEGKAIDERVANSECGGRKKEGGREGGREENEVVDGDVELRS